MKYMLAMLCSKLAATKAVIGGMMARILSVVVRALKHSQTAMHTSVLHRMPAARAGTKASPVLASPIERMFNPTAP